MKTPLGFADPSDSERWLFRLWLNRGVTLLLLLCGVLITERAGAVGGSVFAWGSNGSGECNVPPGLTNAIGVSCGNYFSIALKADGTLSAWGDNSFGLANIPADATNIAVISTRGYDCLALRQDGSLVNWGATYGPIPLEATGIVAIATGGGHHLALRHDGTLLAWGADNYGQCDIPLGATNVIEIEAGYTHSLVLRKDGCLVAWGDDTSGQIDVPSGATNIVSIAVGPDFNLALRADGQLFAWGLNWGGNLPVPAAATNIVAISAGESPDFAVRSDGSVVAWGRNDNGELNVPAGLSPAFTIAAGNFHSLGIRVVGKVALLRQPEDRVVSAGDSLIFDVPAIGQVPVSYQWWHNNAPLPGEKSSVLLLPAAQADRAGTYSLVAQNTSGAVTSRVASVTVLPAAPTITLPPASHVVSLGGDITFGVRAKGTEPLYYQWRHNGEDLASQTNGTLSLAGLGIQDGGGYQVVATNNQGSCTSAVARLEVVPVFAWGANQSGVLDLPFGLTNVIALAAGQAHNLALKSDGTFIGWGDDSSTECDPVAGATNIVAVSAGDEFSLVLRSDGTAISWGNTYAAPDNATNIAAISAGIGYSLALDSNGTALAWGWVNTPSPPPGTDLIAIAAGHLHTLGLRSDGSLVGWGGQALPPDGVSNFIAIAAGDGYSVGLHADGTLLAWGSNSYGQTNIPAQATNIVSIAAGNSHVLAVRDDGQVIVWGNTNSGQAAVPAGLSFPSAVSAGSVHCLALMDTGPLRFSRQPTNQSCPAGNPVSLSAVGVGIGPFSYQWLRDGTNLPGATHAYLTLPDAQALDASKYAVIISNAQGSVTSTVVNLSVNPQSPVIVTEPTSQQDLPGQAAVFNVLATGTEPLAFQWIENGSLIPGATNATMVLTNVQVPSSGNYQVVVTNSLGAVTSIVARLDVFPFNLLTTLTNTTGAWSAAWGDFDNDGRLDLLVGGKAGGSPVSANAELFRSTGDGGFVETNIGLSQSVIGVAWADLDNNGVLDMLLTTWSGAIIYHNNGDGTFSNLSLSLPGDYATAATVADFDRDGKLDILIGGRLYRNLGGNQFTNVNAGLPSVQYGCTAWGDYDNDGYPDLLMCGLTGANAKVQLYHNLGHGVFTNVNAGFTNVYRGAVAWVDYNGDGNLDVLITGQTAAGASVAALYRNNGDGTFTQVPSNLPSVSYSWLAPADFDNDGQSDVFVSGKNGSASLGGLYSGAGGGLFAQTLSPLPTNMAPCAAWGDYDGDGRLDLALTTPISGGQTGIGIYRNDTPATNSPPNGPAGLVAGALPNAVRFAWNPASDAQTPVNALSYNLRVGHAPGASDVLSSSSDASGFRRIASVGNAGNVMALTLTNLPFGQYYWTVQAVDTGFAGSPFAPEESITYVCFTMAATNITASQATLQGMMTANGVASATFFEWGTGTNYGNLTPVQYAGAGTNRMAATALVSGLLPGTGYHCCILVTNAAGAFTGGDQSFTTINVPQIIPSGASSLSATGATLNASVNPNGSPTTVSVEYGLTPSYGNLTQGTSVGGGSIATNVAQAVVGLIGGQVYHYTIIASNSAGISYSPDLTFVTTDEPEALTLPATAIGATTAVLSAAVRPNTLDTWAWFQYGQTTNYQAVTPAQEVGAGTNLVPLGITVTNLTRVTSYHYRVVATNSYATSLGADFTLITTNDVIALAPSNIGMTNATLNGLVNPNGLPTSAVFEYGLTTNYGIITPAFNLSGDTNLLPIVCNIGGLTSTSNYYFRVVATNAAGVRVSGRLGFQTLPLFSVQTPNLAGSVNGSIAWGDYDNDGKLDMLVTDSTSTRIYHNLGGGNFQIIATAIPGVASGHVAWGDYNNDGWLDLLITGTSSAGPITRIYRNNHDGTFTDINAGLPSIAFRSALWGDFDNDGRPDVLLVGETNSAGLSVIYRNNGDGTFSDLHAPLPGYQDASAACADYDNDGRLDILLMGRLGPQYANVFTKLFHNDGKGQFHEAPITLDGFRLGYADWADYDGDGKLDLLIGGNNTALGPGLDLYHNNGNGSFSNVTGSLPQFAPDAVQWGDYDNDGRPDILIRGQQYISSLVPSNSYSGVLHNNGNGTFTTQQFPLPELWSSCGGWADDENNGRLDAVISGNSRTGPLLVYYRNNIPGTNGPPTSPGSLASAVLNNGVELTWSNGFSAAAISNSVSSSVRVGLSPGGGEIISPLAFANGSRQVVGMGNAGVSSVCQLTNLAPGTYYWSVQTVDATFQGSAFAPEQTFVVPGPPRAWTLPATNVLATSATLSAAVFPDYSPANAYFQWGTSTNVGNLAGLSLITNSLVTNFMSASIGGLLPSTTYYYRIVASNGLGASTGSVEQFQTVAGLEIATVSVVPPQTLLLTFTGASSAWYHVLASSNLIDWTDLGTASLSGSNQFQFSEHWVPSPTARFYRLWQP